MTGNPKSCFGNSDAGMEGKIISRPNACAASMLGWMVAVIFPGRVRVVNGNLSVCTFGETSW